MDKAKIKKSYKLLLTMESHQKKLKELEGFDSVRNLGVFNNVMGTNGFSIDTHLSKENEEFLKTIKALVEDFLKRRIEEIETKINDL